MLSASDMITLAFLLSLLALSQSIPCPQVISTSSMSKSGNISSPNYPNPYPPDADCTYLLQGSESQGIEIIFHDLDLEPPYTAGCLSDYIDLDIYDLRDRMTLHKRFCGSTLPSTLTVLHPKAKLVFRSNHAVHHRGFLASYTFVEEGFVKAPNNTQPCGEEIVREGGGVLHFPGARQEIVKPLSGLDCTWLLRVDYNRRIYVRIQELEFQGSIENCHKAQLAIYDGYEHSFDESTVLKKFCGDKAHYKAEDERALLSTRNRLIVRFTTSTYDYKDRASANKNFGFRIVWSEVSSDDADTCAGKKRFSCKETRACISKDHLGTFSTCPQMNYCISMESVCDGIPHCAEYDASDERRCLGRSLNAVIIGAPVSLLVILFLALCTLLLKRRDLLKEMWRWGVCWRRQKSINAYVLDNGAHGLYPPIPPLEGLNRTDNSSVDSASICPLSDSESSDVSMCPYHGHKFMNQLPVLHEVYNLDSDDSSLLPPDDPRGNRRSHSTQYSLSPREQLHTWRLKNRPIKRTDAVCLSDECKSSSGEESPCLCHTPIPHLTAVNNEKVEDSGIELLDSFDLHNQHNSEKVTVIKKHDTTTVHRSIQTDADTCLPNVKVASTNTPETPFDSPIAKAFHPLCSTVTTFGVYPESTSTDV
ncbi:unnamed protein product [Allacma fusca]|uniref:CUB domain-containing protein n=1 Tax=Allacma fusca TaxID=39272 RepID=A0A8J2KSM7_9HEXA|nr:unnamed protein product [Allacma fusca]